MKRKYCDRINHRHFKNLTLYHLKSFFKLLQSLGVNWDVRCASRARRQETETASIITSSHTSPRPQTSPHDASVKRSRRPTGLVRLSSDALRFLRSQPPSSPSLLVHKPRTAPSRGLGIRDGIDAIPGPRGRFVAGQLEPQLRATGLGRG